VQKTNQPLEIMICKTYQISLFHLFGTEDL
jgi:hypothetical protein